MQNYKRLYDEIKKLNKEIAKKDSIIELQSNTNQLLVLHLQNVMKLEEQIKNNNMKINALLLEKIILQ